MILLSGALGYIGPGAGLGLLGALIGVLLAVAGAMFFVVFWPVRMLLRRARGTAGGEHVPSQDESPPAGGQGAGAAFRQTN